MSQQGFQHPSIEVPVYLSPSFSLLLNVVERREEEERERENDRPGVEIITLAVFGSFHSFQTHTQECAHPSHHHHHNRTLTSPLLLSETETEWRDDQVSWNKTTGNGQVVGMSRYNHFTTSSYTSLYSSFAYPESGTSLVIVK